MQPWLLNTNCRNSAVARWQVCFWKFGVFNEEGVEEDTLSSGVFSCPVHTQACLLVCFWFFQSRFLCVALAVMELVLLPRLSWNSWRSIRLPLPLVL